MGFPFVSRLGWSAVVVLCGSALAGAQDTQELLLVPDSTGDRVMAFSAQTGDLVDADFIPADAVNLDAPMEILAHPTRGTLLVSVEDTDVVSEYSYDGNYIGTFAPAGGANTAQLEEPRGMALLPNGNVLVVCGAGTNANAVIEFDVQGAYVGPLVAAGAGGLDMPFDVIYRDSTSDLLVGGAMSDQIHRYNIGGTSLGNFAAVDSFPGQMNVASNGNVLVANNEGTNVGVLEFTSAGLGVGSYNPMGLSDYRGIHELPNGNLFVTTGTGVYEINRISGIVDTKITGVEANFLGLVTIPDLGSPVKITQFGMKINFAKRAKSGVEDVDTITVRGRINPAAIAAAGVDLRDFENVSASIALDGSGADLGTPAAISSKAVTWSIRDEGGGKTRLTLVPATGDLKLTAKKIDIADLNDPINAVLAMPVNIDLTVGLDGFVATTAIEGLYLQKKVNSVGKFTYRWGKVGAMSDGVFFIDRMKLEQRVSDDVTFQRVVFQGCLRGTNGTAIDPTNDTTPITVGVGDFTEDIPAASFVTARNGFGVFDPVGENIEFLAFDSRKGYVVFATPWMDATGLPFGVSPVFDPDNDRRQSLELPISIQVDDTTYNFLVRLGRKKTAFVTGVPTLLEPPPIVD